MTAFFEEGPEWFRSNKKKKKDEDDDVDDDGPNQIKRLLDRIHDETWETVMDYTSLDDDQVEELKAALVRVGEKARPKKHDLELCAAAFSLMADAEEDLKSELKRNQLKRAMRIGKMVKAKYSRMERREKRVRDKKERESEKKAAAE